MEIGPSATPVITELALGRQRGQAATTGQVEQTPGCLADVYGWSGAGDASKWWYLWMLKKSAHFPFSPSGCQRASERGGRLLGDPLGMARELCVLATVSLAEPDVLSRPGAACAHLSLSPPGQHAC